MFSFLVSISPSYYESLKKVHSSSETDLILLASIDINPLKKNSTYQYHLTNIHNNLFISN